MSLILKVEDLNMNYNSGGRPLSVLQSININIEEGETVAITGPSGSGKTTLMGLCAALDNPSSGEITLLGTKISPLNEDERAKLRNRYVGFIFQNFQLLPSLTAIENVHHERGVRRSPRHERRRDGHLDDRPHDHHSRERRTEAGAPRRDPSRRSAVVPGLQRAWLWFGPRLAPDPCGP